VFELNFEGNFRKTWAWFHFWRSILIFTKVTLEEVAILQKLCSSAFYHHFRLNHLNGSPYSLFTATLLTAISSLPVFLVAQTANFPLSFHSEHPVSSSSRFSPPSSMVLRYLCSHPLSHKFHSFPVTKYRFFPGYPSLPVYLIPFLIAFSQLSAAPLLHRYPIPVTIYRFSPVLHHYLSTFYYL